MELKHSLLSGISFRSLGPLDAEGYASSNALDRMNDILEPSGMRKVNGTVPLLAAHDSSMPIGRARLWQSGNKIATRLTFAPEGASEDADKWRKLVKAGVVDTLSVGFNPIKWEPLMRDF